jgi:tight adherence protein B
MDTRLIILFIAFVAAALFVDAIYALWAVRHGPEPERIARRLRLMASGERGDEAASILKLRHWDNATATDRILIQLPGVPRIEKLLLQAGSPLTLTRLAARMLGFAIIGALVGLLWSRLLGATSSAWLGVLLTAAIFAVLPLAAVLRAKFRRMNEFLLQMPDALDLVGRAMRAGHAFNGGLKMVGDEMRDPIGTEFRVAFEELNLGLSLENAMLNLLERIDVAELRYFVVTVLIQRESGGNLAEILDKISHLIRERIKLLGRVRVLTTQGRLEAWVLTALPLVVGGILFTISPKLISILWTEPAGRTMLGITALMLLTGIVVMWRMVRIRV